MRWRYRRNRIIARGSGETTEVDAEKLTWHTAGAILAPHAPDFAIVNRAIAVH